MKISPLTGFTKTKKTKNMRLLLIFSLLVSSVLTYAQTSCRYLPDPGEVSQGGALSINSLVSPGYGSFVAVGLTSLAADGTSERSFVTAFSCSSVGSVSKRLSNGVFNVIRTVPGGGFIAGGIRTIQGSELAYLCRFNAGLDTLSTMSLSHSTDRIEDIVVSSDGSFAVGVVSFGKVSILRFNSAGVMVWKREIPNSTYGTPMLQAVQLLTSGTNICVVNTELNQFGNDDIALHKLDVTTGDETFHRTYGSSTENDWIRDAKWMGSELVLLTNIGNSRTGLIRLNSSMNVALAVVLNGGQLLIGLQLLTNTDGYSFIGGRITEAGVEYSVVWQVWYNGAVGWRRKLNQYSSVCADMLFEGPNLVVPTNGGMQFGFMMSYVSTSTGFMSGPVCEPQGPAAITGNPYPDMATGFPSLLTTLDVNFVSSLGSSLNAYSGVIDPCVDVTLPVEALYFRASPEGQRVLLEWATATEHANDHYTIERSALGDAFEDVAVVDGAGDSQQETEYRAYDENPLPGTSYYRLRQTDIDGTISYSDVVAVEFSPTDMFVPYPNPANAGNEIRVNGFVTAYDELGRKVVTGKDFIVLPSGKYFLRSESGQSATVTVL